MWEKETPHCRQVGWKTKHYKDSLLDYSLVYIQGISRRITKRTGSDPRGYQKISLFFLRLSWSEDLLSAPRGGGERLLLPTAWLGDAASTVLASSNVITSTIAQQATTRHCPSNPVANLTNLCETTQLELTATIRSSLSSSSCSLHSK